MDVVRNTGLTLMLENSKAFSAFASGDIRKAKEFYTKTLGLKVTE